MGQLTLFFPLKGHMSYEDTMLVGQNKILAGHHQTKDWTLYRVKQRTYFANVKENFITGKAMLFGDFEIVLTQSKINSR